MKINKDNCARMTLKLTGAIWEVFNEENIHHIPEPKTEQEMNDFLYSLLALMPTNIVNKLWVLWEQDILETNYTANRLIAVNINNK